MVYLWWLMVLSSGMVAEAAPPRRWKVRVISDIHAGSCWQGNQSALFEFLQQTAVDDVDVLVLNGDVYDFWLIPLDKPSPSFDDSITRGLNPSLGFDMPRFRKLLRAAANSVVALYQDNGNHDMWLTGSLARKGFSDVPEVWEPGVVNKWGVHFEHGHLHSLFNQVPPHSSKMPIGYFVTRSVATYACDSQERVTAWLSQLIKAVLGTSIIDDVAVETLRQPTIFKLLLRKILDTASDGKLPGNLSVPVVGVVSADRIPKAGDTSSNYTLAHFVDQYADTLDRFVEEVGYERSARMISADVVAGALDIDVGRGSIDQDVIVLGHTHVPTLQVVKRDTPYFSRTSDVLVANAGAWVADDRGKSRHSYLDITIDDIVEDFPDCYTKADGSDYRGTVHSTNRGTTCVPWGYGTLRKTEYFKAFGGVAFCRNLGDGTAPWCYTGEVSWGYCDVGPPSAHCPTNHTKGAIAVELFSFGNSKPLSAAYRLASTGSRWAVVNEAPNSTSNLEDIVV